MTSPVLFAAEALLLEVRGLQGVHLKLFLADHAVPKPCQNSVMPQ